MISNVLLSVQMASASRNRDPAQNGRECLAPPNATLDLLVFR